MSYSIKKMTYLPVFYFDKRDRIKGLNSDLRIFGRLYAIYIHHLIWTCLISICFFELIVTGFM